VELHPATDLWMRGARFGTIIEETGTTFYKVKLDKLPTPVLVHPDNLRGA
jgi:hypothetical protein